MESKLSSDPDIESLINTIDAEMRAAEDPAYYDLKPSSSAAYKALKKEPVERQTEIARYLFINRTRIMRKQTSTVNSYELAGRRRGFPVFQALMRGTLELPPEEVLGWAQTLQEECKRRSVKKTLGIWFSDWPIAGMVQQIERHARKNSLSDDVLKQLQAMLEWPEMQGAKSCYGGTDFAKVRKRIETLLGAAGGVELKLLPYKKLSGDKFGDPLEAEIKAMKPEAASFAHQVLNHAASASGSKPAGTFRDETKSLIETHGRERFRKLVQEWLGRAIAAKPGMSIQRYQWDSTVHEFTEERVFTDSNIVVLKGLVWMCDGFQDARTVNLVADLCEKAMKKVPGRGPAAQATANACLWYLETTPGTEATARLSRLGTAIKQKSVQKRVQQIVAKKAQQAGITTIQLEERVVPDYGLTNGVKTVTFDEFALEIQVDGPHKLKQTWLKPDGSPQKSMPKLIKEKGALKTKFDKVKTEVAALKKVLTAQRDRIDRLFAEDLEWSLDEVEQYYVGHDLVGTIGTKLIWTLNTGDRTTSALHRDGKWQDVTGATVRASKDTRVRLWHPVDAGVEEVMAWRERLAAVDFVQPMKQAHREVYLLTDAERRTGVYSNRMAAHILKQHQMATLMAARGWRYQLMGAYDDGLDDQFASKTFVTSTLRAEYLIHTNLDDENWNEAGIFLYVGTDQLRFVETDDSPVPLERIPQRLFSETMREADLFVGVASVGNDPAWFDQGPTPESRNYWQSYSFGDLDGFAETRKQVLEALLPRLKIRDVARIEGRFLYIEGKLNTYKIHLGSSNILMEPGDRYLCIVPGAVPKAAQISLPFEGDNRMSVILSKALMLAEDDKIDAADIVSQLKR